MTADQRGVEDPDGEWAKWREEEMSVAQTEWMAVWERWQGQLPEERWPLESSGHLSAEMRDGDQLLQFSGSLPSAEASCKIV